MTRIPEVRLQAGATSAMLVGFVGAMVGLWAVQGAHEPLFHLGQVLLLLSGVLVGYGEGVQTAWRAAARRYLGEQL